VRMRGVSVPIIWWAIWFESVTLPATDTEYRSLNLLPTRYSTSRRRWCGIGHQGWGDGPTPEIASQRW